MKQSVKVARPLDHLVLPVSNLEIARDRLNALGFTVAPDAIHPFGTENCCVFFKDDSFLEPLAIAHRETCEKAALRGNVFVGRDQVFRFRKGDNGFSAMVFGTNDAEKDHKEFRKENFSAGKMLKFMRDVDDGKGNIDKAGFKLAFTHDPRSPDSFFFTCERVNPPKIDKSELQRHKNGALGIKEVVLTESNPTDFQYVLQEVINQREVDSHSFGMDLKSGSANIAVYTPAGFEAYFGERIKCHSRGMRLRAFVVGVKSLAKAKSVLNKSKIAFDEIAGRLVVKPEIGQGYFLAFEKA